MLSSLGVSVSYRTFQTALTIWLLIVHSSRAQLTPRASTIAAPLSIPPSQDWDGNDGPWSSFTLQVGTPAQIVKVFVSTAGSQTWVVAEEGCGAGDPTLCTKTRGGLYNYTASSSWVSNIANISNDIYALGLDAELGYDDNGRYGFDDITLGFQGGGGPSLNNQTLAGIATKSFFLGLFGLAAKPSSFVNGNDSIPSFIQNLKNQSKIPSQSWGYTAGNQYRVNEVLGSLTLGGYDASRFLPNNATFPFSTVPRGELSVQVQAISTGSGAISLLPSPVAAYLDSSVAFMYLPVDACTLFETAFGITWDNSSELYFISDTQRMLLEAQNPNIVFTLGSTVPNQVNISLPYSAFDLTASWPLVANTTRYFPLRRANDSSQYTLGRAFFQEAYMIADYERGNFSISQCKWDSAPEDIVPILSPNASSASKPLLPIGAIAGIAAGGAALVIFVAILLWCLWWRPRRRKQKAIELAANDNLTTPAIAQQKTQEEYVKPELDSSQVPRPQIVIHEADSRKVVPPVEIGENQPIYEMPGQDLETEMPATPVERTVEGERDQSGIQRFRAGSGRRIDRVPTPGTETWSTVTSGWASPGPPEVPRDQARRKPLSSK